ncbi:hypothetical protein DFS34DRAFT_633128 [Phlyctochytrium arcticum]|nr:hypothetical protein DFS34DRAFT_633128 [Phlyctochytrium arcticum]
MLTCRMSRRASSRQKIKKYLYQKYKGITKSHNKYINSAIQQGVEKKNSINRRALVGPLSWRERPRYRRRRGGYSMSYFRINLLCPIPFKCNQRIKISSGRPTRTRNGARKVGKSTRCKLHGFLSNSRSLLLEYGPFAFHASFYSFLDITTFGACFNLLYTSAIHTLSTYSP